MLFKSLLSPIKTITSSLTDSNHSTSHVGGSLLAPLSLSTITNLVSTPTLTNTVSSITGGAANNPLGAVTNILGSVTGESSGSPLDSVTHIIGGVTGGTAGNPLGAVTGIIGGITGGTDGGPLGAVTGIIGGITGGVSGGEGGPLGAITGIIGGITGGDLSHNPVTGVIQTGIDVLQGLESLKTDIINTGINTVADTIISTVHQSEHPIGDLANLGTLTFETSRDTVNGTLEAISDLAGADIGGAAGALTGVVGTLINNGSTASGLVQHIAGDLTNAGGIIGGEGGPLGAITGIIGGITGGDLGNNPVTGVIQSGIDVLQGVESLKTDLINTGITTVGGAIGSVLPGVHPVTDLTNLGTLTFETSRDTVNGTLEAISDLAGADIGGAAGSLTGVVGTLINNGSTASGLVQHIAGDLTDVGGLLGGITGGIGGGEGGPLGAITGIIGGITGGASGGIGGDLLGSVTGVIGGITGGASGGIGGDLLGSVTGVIGGITGGASGGIGGDLLGSVTGVIGGITGGASGGIGGDLLGSVTGVIGGGINSGDIISGIAQPIQTVISNGNVTVDALQTHVSTLFGDDSFNGINDLISVTAGDGDYSINGSVDSILDALTGTVSSGAGIAVGEPNPNGGSLTDLVSLQSSLGHLTDHLFSSVNHF
ncbi:hypothetical protein [Acinetobacter sp. A47]|uniref:hypothetical protein n=1 Tax=Acinetobacter sp. A47 TaxID=1561217 RepID=UPI00056F9C73|nr:hypothetical protein [Acinetobacter sp. A47]